MTDMAEKFTEVAKKMGEKTMQNGKVKFSTQNGKVKIETVFDNKTK